MRRVVIPLFFALLAALAVAQTVSVAGSGVGTLAYGATSGTYTACGELYPYELTFFDAHILLAPNYPMAVVLDGVCYKPSLYPHDNVTRFVVINDASKVAYVIDIDIGTGRVSVQARTYSTYAVYANLTNAYYQVTGVRFLTAEAFRPLWKAFGGAASAAGNATVVYAPIFQTSI